MNQITEIFGYGLLIGTAATGVMDLGGLAIKRMTGTPLPRYDLVGRWIAWMARGRFMHASIAASPAIHHETLLGWATHYAIGAAFAMVLLGIWGVEWASNPTVAPALIAGIGSIAAPLLLMQPCMGSGIASRLAPNPTVAGVRSLINHALFAGGLYAAGWLTRWLVVSL